MSDMDSYANFGSTSVAGGAGGRGTVLGATDTICYIPVGDHAKLPSAAPFRAQLGPTEFVEVSAVDTANDKLTLVRGNNLPAGDADVSPAGTWAVGTTLVHGATAGSLGKIVAAIEAGRFYVVEDARYGAKGDGTTDDTAAVQAAINAADAAGGGIVFFSAPAADYLISSTLNVNSDNVALLGASWASHLVAKATFAAGTPMIHVNAPGGAGNFRRGIRIVELYVDGNNVSGVGGIQLDSTYHALIDHCWVRYCTGTGVFLTGNSSARGAYTMLNHTTISDGGAGIGLMTNYAENNQIIGGLISHYQTSGGVGAKLEDGVNQFFGTVFDNCDRGLWVYFANANQFFGCQFTNSLTNHIYLNGAQKSVISGCYFDAFLGSGSQNMINVDNAHNIIIGCTVNENTGWTNFIHEFGSSCEGNLYANNYTAGLPIVLAFGSSSVTRGNIGHNPQESLATPPAPTVSNNTTGGTVAAGTYGVEVTLVTEGGETQASPPSSTVTTTGTSTITITAPAAQGNAIGWYAYATQPGGATYTRQQPAGHPTGLGANLTLTAPPTNTGATAPTSNSTDDVGTPAVPASTVAQINTTGVDCTVYVTGGTVTQIAVGKKTTGLISGAIRVPANQSITLTYSVAPTWSWIGE